MRIINYICVFLVCGMICCMLWINILQKENKRLEAEKNGYKIEVERQRKVIENAKKRKEETSKLEIKDKEVFDWQYYIGGTAVVNELRLQCKSCSNSTY